MEISQIFDQIAKTPLSSLIKQNPHGGYIYADCIHKLIHACLKDFDEAIYRAYVDKGEFRQELLDLKEGKIAANQFSKQDLQLFLMIQQKAEDFAAGQIASIIINTILLKVAREILAEKV